MATKLGGGAKGLICRATKKKVIFLVVRTTKALVVIRNFFFRLKIAGNGF